MAAPMCFRWARSFQIKCRFAKGINTKNARFMCTSRGENTTEGSTEDARIPDAESVFMDPRVQSILYKITGFQLDHIFRPRQIANLKAPQYKLLTDRQLAELQTKALKRGEERIQMPAFMKPWQDKLEVVSDDPKIDGHDTAKYVFTDITYGIKERAQTMVVRESSGLLRLLTLEERVRIEQIYFPKPGRMFRMPRMFQPHKLEVLLNKGKYEYILDRACVQFEPDDPEYIRVTQRTYEHIDSQRSYETLYSTRHCGVMAFYLVLYRKVDGLIADRIQQDQLSDAGDLVRLYHIVHPTCQSARISEEQNITTDIDLIKLFASDEAKKGSVIELALQTYLESRKPRAARA